MRVPGVPAAGCTPSRLIAQSSAASSVRLVMVTSATESMLARASPRNPKLATLSRSVSVRILLVACRLSARGKSSLAMPQPLSATTMRLMPPSSRRTSMSSAPASREFSTSSLTTEAGRSITSPAAIWLISRSDSSRIGRRGAAFTFSPTCSFISDPQIKRFSPPNCTRPQALPEHLRPTATFGKALLDRVTFG